MSEYLFAGQHWSVLQKDVYKLLEALVSLPVSSEVWSGAIHL